MIYQIMTNSIKYTPYFIGINIAVIVDISNIVDMMYDIFNFRYYKPLTNTVTDYEILNLDINYHQHIKENCIGTAIDGF